jgi:hypothetical protein
MSILIPLLFAVSCNDWLELIPPDGLVQDEYWKSKADVAATLMGAYHKFAQMDEKLFLYGELRGDMIIQDVNTPNSQRLIMESNIYPDNELCDWSDFYSIITLCNSILKHAPEIYEFDPTFTEYQLRGYEAEALFLRSLAYFYLVRIFKDVPLVLHPSESDEVDFFLPTSPDTTVLRVIEEDLNRARLGVSEVYATLENNLGRATKGSILALLADINLWNFNYEKCIGYINEIETLGYSLMPSGRWFNIFYPGNSLEGILELQFDASLDQGNSLYDYTYWNNYYLASSSAVELLDPETTREIIRGDGSIDPHRNKIWKYCGASGDGETLRSSALARSGNWIVYRYADVLLMKAEALSQTGRFEEALQILNNQIRNRAKVEPLELTFTSEAFEDAILEERARELAFEGKRWFDLLRMGRRNNNSRKNKLIEFIILKAPAAQKLVIASKLTNPLGWYLPIEEDELERNNMLVQNPFYADYSTDD